MMYLICMRLSLSYSSVELSAVLRETLHMENFTRQVQGTVRDIRINILCNSLE